MGEIIAALYPHDLIYEEVALPDRLVLDYLIPGLRMVVECQGRQHEEYVPFFHGTRSEYHASQERDTRKRDWCELNGLFLVEIPHDATDERITELVRGNG